MKMKTLNKIITIVIPVFICFLFFIKEKLITFAGHLPPCLFYRIFHLYCPACGNTRSVTALLHGDIVTALRFNVIPILFGIILLFAYIEFAFSSFGKQIRLLPRSLAFYLTLIVLMIVYAVLRNFVPYLTP
jgi:hypothetical protein